MKLLAGLDIGGTKCAASIGAASDGTIELLDKKQFPTPSTPEETIIRLGDTLIELLALQGSDAVPAGIGISCGGPLDSRTGLVLSPPNLPGWDTIDVVSPVRERFGVSTLLQNDANACALAEWQWGAGKGLDQMIFLTFGTGMGAGLVLNGKLYAGTNDMAGEIGHIRMADDGPGGYGKTGSFEGFCSGGGIAHLAQLEALKRLQRGERPPLCPTLEQLPFLDARMVGKAAERGDELALAVMRQTGEKLGAGLALLVDLLNPQCIVIGSIYGRQQSLLEPYAMAKLKKEAHPRALAACRIVPAFFGEQIGDYASLSVALYASADNN
ncbi:ROK family protein [Paenibacillus sp. PAMC21692]|uniref:ROK family protein n=1 Tax=Paenibacillus sp. PAMC21692 TaxID=2762320 RepID=UPI00164E6E78|nr:ROK family protein [Paenibacillus sp. PAMC21692]QNK54429.1 ROK family protein [Paenibacillus sp. PAMC21692]